jgi:hypothetical protein
MTEKFTPEYVPENVHDEIMDLVSTLVARLAPGGEITPEIEAKVADLVNVIG